MPVLILLRPLFHEPEQVASDAGSGLFQIVVRVGESDRQREHVLVREEDLGKEPGDVQQNSEGSAVEGEAGVPAEEAPGFRPAAASSPSGSDGEAVRVLFSSERGTREEERSGNER